MYLLLCRSAGGFKKRFQIVQSHFYAQKKFRFKELKFTDKFSQGNFTFAAILDLPKH